MNKRKTLFTALGLGAIVALFVGLCSAKLDSPIWFDEAYSHYLARGNFSEIWAMTALDVHPPLFYFALKTWSLIFGNSVVAMRGMSVFFGAIAIILAFFLVKKLSAKFTRSPLIPLVAALGMAVCPIFIRYGEEMRMYTMVTALVFGAALVLEQALETQKTRYWLLYAVLISLGMWTHYFSALAWIAQLLYIAYRQGIFKKGGLKSFWHSRTRRQIIGSYALAVALYAPWLPSFLAQSADVQGGFWISEISVSTVTDYASNTLVFHNGQGASSWLAALVIATIAALVFLITRTKRELGESSRSFRLLTLLATIPPLLLCVLSLPPLTPIFVDRYCLYAIAASWLVFALFVALAFRFQKLRLPALVTAALLIACSVCGINKVFSRIPESRVAITLSELQSIDSSAPVLAAADFLFYDLVPYSNSERPIYFYGPWCDYRWGSLEPFRSIGYNVLDSLDDFESTNDKFWLFTYSDRELPEDPIFSAYRIAATLETDDHRAYLLTK